MTAMGRVLLFAYAAAVFLLGWWPWNVLLVLLACACRSRRLQHPKFLFNP
jgi:hypothetical protein